MGVVTVLQLGNAIAGEGVPVVFVGASMPVTLTIFDDVTQQAVDTADQTVQGTLVSPLGSSVALVFTRAASGVYKTIAALLAPGDYAVTASGTAVGGFVFNIQAPVTCGDGS